MSNIDKLMQMATLEQLNIMIQQMSKSTSYNEPKDVLSLPIVQKVILAYEDELKNKESVSSCNCKDYTSLLDNILNQVQSHNTRFQRIENKLDELLSLIENKSENKSELPMVIDKNQTKLFSFPGFFHYSNILEDLEPSLEVSSEDLVVAPEDLEVAPEDLVVSPEDLESCLEKENITLNIEETEPEKEINDTNIDLEILNEELSEEDEEVVEDEEEDEEAAEDKVAIEDEAIEEDESVEEDEAVEEDESDENVSTEEEVATEDELEDQVELIKEDEAVEKEEDVEEDVEEDEEVFEIEIDDITYFATDEENGILYEVDKDGEVGKKVGIIKDGEPIFS